MESWRLVVGFISLVIGVVLAGVAFHGEHYWAFAGFIVAGLAAAASVVFWEDWTEPRSYLPPLVSIVFTFLSVSDAFSTSHALNSEETKAQVAFLQKLIDLDNDPAELDDSERVLVKKAIGACSMQGAKDNVELINNAQKALRMGPGTTLIDGVDSQLDSEKPPQRCLDYYRELRKTKAKLFSSLEQTFPWLLKQPKT